MHAQFKCNGCKAKTEFLWLEQLDTPEGFKAYQCMECGCVGVKNIAEALDIPDSKIDRCKEWFKNNKIEVLLRYRLDKDEFPCVTIALNSSSEIEDMRHLADTSTESVVLMPSDINKPINYIVKPFVPSEVDNDSGFVGI